MRQWSSGGGGVGSLAFLPGGLLAGGMEDGSAAVWTPAGECGFRVPSRGQWAKVAAGLSGRLVVLAGRDVMFYDHSDARPVPGTLHVSDEDFPLPSCLCVLGRRVLACVNNRVVCGFLSGVPSIWESPSGEYVLAGSLRNLPLAVGRTFGTPGRLHVRDAPSGAVRAELTFPDMVACAAFAGDGRRLAAGCVDGTFGVRDWTTGAAVWQARAPDDPVWCVAFDRTGRALAVGTKGGLVRLFDADTGRERTALDGEAGGVITLAFAPDGLTLAAGHGDDSGADRVVLWDVGG